MIKLLDDRALEPLVLIINNIINTGVVPASFKMAIITPIYKKDNPCKAENYRPISLLSNFSKIFERVIKSRLANYLEENQILPPSQFGFRKGLNTEGAINSLTQSIHHALAYKKKVIGIFMDLSKAFDSVCHSKLIYYLDKIGIKHNALNLFKSYLEHRTHKVQIDNVIISSCKIMSLGVPQGTVLSPLLYIIYVTGLSNLQIDSSLYSYADDTALLISDNTWDSVVKKAETSLKKGRYLVFKP